MIYRIRLLIFMICLWFMSCDNMKYHRTSSGLQYRVLHREKDGREVRIGDIMKLRIQRFIEGRPLDGQVPFTQYIAYTDVTSQADPADRYRFLDIFSVLKEGDSIWMRVPMDSLFADQLQKPSFYTPAQYLTFTIKLVQLMTGEQQQKEEQQLTQQNSRHEFVQITQYIRSRGWRVEVKRGIFFNKEVLGRGVVATQGDKITLRYRGELLNGSVFDSNFLDSTHKNVPPLSFELGSSQLIDGFTRALEGVRTGERLHFIIPSRFAYGTRGAGNIIPPNAPLHFYVWIEKIQKKAKVEQEDNS